MPRILLGALSLRYMGLMLNPTPQEQKRMKLAFVHTPTEYSSHFFSLFLQGGCGLSCRIPVSVSYHLWSTVCYFLRLISAPRFERKLIPEFIPEKNLPIMIISKDLAVLLRPMNKAPISTKALLSSNEFLLCGEKIIIVSLTWWSHLYVIVIMRSNLI